MTHRRDQEPRRVDVPEPGFFAIRLVKGGPKVAATIERDAAGVWSTTIDGVRQSGAAHTDPALAEGVFRIWHYGERITEAEHRYLIDFAAYVRVHVPDAPEANPTQPIVIGRLLPAF